MGLAFKLQAQILHHYSIIVLWFFYLHAPQCKKVSNYLLSVDLLSVKQELITHMMWTLIGCCQFKCVKLLTKLLLTLRSSLYDQKVCGHLTNTFIFQIFTRKL